MDQTHGSASRVRHSAAYWAGVLKEHEASGRSLRAFARERGLSPWTLYAWRGKLLRSSEKPMTEGVREASGFVAVDVVGERRTASEIEVVLSDGMRVRVPRDVVTERLVELVRALRTC
jgi:ferric-dicitrate binding protein FerR (iron transport regulator)